MDASRQLMAEGRGDEVDPRGPTASKVPRGKIWDLPGKPEGPR